MAYLVPSLISVDNPANTDEDDAWNTVIALLNGANAGGLQGFKNRLINGSFRINQRAPATNADDTYCLDRWYVLTQTGTVAVTQQTDPETGAITGVRLTQSQASAQRMGLAQIIESANCRDLRSVVATLAGRVRLSTADDVRYAVLEHTGTADSVTSDVVNSWTNTTYTAGQFFIAGVNVLAVGEVTTAAATWRDLTALNASVGASSNNLIAFVWTENAVAQNVTLDLNRMQLEPGSTASIFELRPMAVELALCERYYEKSFALATAPAQNVGTVTGEWRFPALAAGAVTNRAPDVRYRVRKRTSPTRTTYNPAAANAEARDIQAAADCSSVSLGNGSESGFSISVTGNASTAISNWLGFHWTADAEL